MQEPSTPYKPTDSPPTTRQVTVQSTGYPPLKTNPGAGAWRRIPWINLRGFWLEQAEFEIETQYTIEVYDRRLVFKIVDG
ncbi:SymE family type I addiction module toxin [Marinagarivorans algicola]|uniref:SymE family type I addiction module toxin n=1 Tax=Marinagarivorans algicola TaxID=1513270 RepID=UPI0009E6EA5E|nr:SymE family type I addiction module toxin [Marinagarivorans algicola]